MTREQRAWRAYWAVREAFLDVPSARVWVRDRGPDAVVYVRTPQWRGRLVVRGTRTFGAAGLRLAYSLNCTAASMQRLAKAHRAAMRHKRVPRVRP